MLLPSLDTDIQLDEEATSPNFTKVKWFPSLIWTKPSWTQEDMEDKHLANLMKRLDMDVNERKQKGTLMIANNTFWKYAKMYHPGPNPISNRE